MQFPSWQPFQRCVFICLVWSAQGQQHHQHSQTHDAAKHTTLTTTPLVLRRKHETGFVAANGTNGADGVMPAKVWGPIVAGAGLAVVAAGVSAGVTVQQDAASMHRKTRGNDTNASFQFHSNSSTYMPRIVSAVHFGKQYMATANATAPRQAQGSPDNDCCFQCLVVLQLQSCLF